MITTKTLRRLVAKNFSIVDKRKRGGFVSMLAYGGINQQSFGGSMAEMKRAMSRRIDWDTREYMRRICWMRKVLGLKITLRK